MYIYKAEYTKAKTSQRNCSTLKAQNDAKPFLYLESTSLTLPLWRPYCDYKHVWDCVIYFSTLVLLWRCSKGLLRTRRGFYFIAHAPSQLAAISHVAVRSHTLHRCKAEPSSNVISILWPRTITGSSLS